MWQVILTNHKACQRHLTLLATRYERATQERRGFPISVCLADATSWERLKHFHQHSWTPLKGRQQAVTLYVHSYMFWYENIYLNTTQYWSNITFHRRFLYKIESYFIAHAYFSWIVQFWMYLLTWKEIIQLFYTKYSF
jgi:hypothetical protein